MLNIKIVKTETKVYKVDEQDKDFYEDNDVVNVHMAALYDIKCLEDGNIGWVEIEASIEDDTSYTVVLVDEDNNEVPVDEIDKVRDEELFPEDDEEEDDVQIVEFVSVTEKPADPLTGMIY